MSTKKILIITKEKQRIREISANRFVKLFRKFFPKKISQLDMFLKSEKFSISMKNVPSSTKMTNVTEEKDGIYCHFENWNEQDSQLSLASIVFTKKEDSERNKITNKISIKDTDYYVFFILVNT